MFHLPNPFKRPPTVSEVAELRDRCIAAETRAMLLEDLVNRKFRPQRERRKDAIVISDAIGARTERYRDRFSHLTDAQRSAAISRATDKQRGQGK